MDLKHVDRYGKNAVAALENLNVAHSAKNWGTSKDGHNQLFEHTMGARVDPRRLKGLEERAGLPYGTLQGAKSADSSDINRSLMEMDSLAQNIKTSAADQLKKSTDGKKVAYWARGKETSSEGIAVLEYEGKIQSVMPMKEKTWNQFNVDTRPENL